MKNELENFGKILKQIFIPRHEISFIGPDYVVEVDTHMRKYVRRTLYMSHTHKGSFPMVRMCVE